ncbi:MAG: restriction endonuclease [Bacilli bacterium]|nr:restriction endonuclease [Bacilli bacterium]
MKQKLTVKILIEETRKFCEIERKTYHKELYGVTDGKAIGTYVEHKLKQYLAERFDFTSGNSASGIDLPDESINTDIKVTSIRQPQSSCPYKSSRQKIYGLGYNLLVLVYDKIDDENGGLLKFLNVTFVEKERTGDFTTTKRIIEMLRDGANKDDLIAYFTDRNIPGDEITYLNLAEELLSRRPKQGYLTISNALQWRLQYGRVIALNNEVDGVNNHDFN